MKNVLVTGGSGYFGESLIYFLKTKNLNIFSLDLNDPINNDHLEKFYKCDILELSKKRHILENIDVVYHCVANVPLSKNKRLFYRNNVEGTRILLDACLERNLNKIVLLSSSAVYGIPKTNPVSEVTITSPMEDYGKAKLESEKICFEEKYHSLNINIIRPRTILGKGRLGIFEILFDWIEKGHNVPVLNDGKNIYQFVHSDDLANACYMASFKKGKNIYNCGTNDYSDMRSVLENLCHHAKTGSKVKSLPMTIIEPLMKISSFLNISPLAPYHSMMYGRSLYFDNKKISSLGWKSKYSNNEMFIESYENYIKNKSNLLKYNNVSAHRKKVKRKILNLVKYFI
jgi:nucleoside-diphosphate-sugar epimerase